MDISSNWHVIKPVESRVVWLDGQQWFVSVWLADDGNYAGKAITQQNNTATALFTGEDATAEEVLNRVLREIHPAIIDLANVKVQRGRASDSPLQKTQLAASVATDCSPCS